MSEIIANEGGGKHKGKRRPKKHSTHIDMTPMVDLACLLLTFFMLTTAFSKPKVMEIVLPEKKEIKDPPKLDKDKVITVILDEKDKVYYYLGLAEPGKPLPTLVESNFSKDGLRKLFLGRNKELFKNVTDYNEKVMKEKKNIPADTLKKEIRALKKADKVGPFIMIKAAENVKYGNIVDVIDELEITNIARYAIVDLNPVEKKMLEEKKSTTTK